MYALKIIDRNMYYRKINVRFDACTKISKSFHKNIIASQDKSQVQPGQPTTAVKFLFLK